MKIVYEKPTIYLTAKEIEAIHQTMEIVRELGYEDEEKALFNIREDGFNSVDLFEMFNTLKDIIEKRAKILTEDEN